MPLGGSIPPAPLPLYFEPARTSKDGKVRPGYWRASYRDTDGRRRTVSGPTRVQAENRREVKRAEIAAQPAVGSRFSRETTVAELTDWWLDSVARHQVKTSKLDSYREFASYLTDDIGTHSDIDVGPEVLTQWQSNLLEKYAPYTVLNCRKVCRQAFTEAVKFRLIPANPFDLVKAPRAKGVNQPGQIGVIGCHRPAHRGRCHTVDCRTHGALN